MSEEEDSHLSRSSSSSHDHSHSSIGYSHSSTGYGSSNPAVPPSPGTTRRLDEEKRMSLEERHQQMNALFGIKPFKSHISRRRVGERSAAVRDLYEAPKTTFSSIPGTGIGNFMWVILFGWILYLFYTIAAFFLYITYFGRPYSSICWQMKNYVLWPFGKYLEKFPIYEPRDTYPLEGGRESLGEETQLVNERGPGARGRGGGMGRGCRYSAGLLPHIVYLLIAVPLLAVVHGFVLVMCWMSVVMIPMAKVNLSLLSLLLRSDPLALSVVTSYPRPGAEILLYTTHAANVNYYKYTVGGMNVVLIIILLLVSLLLDLLPFVFLSLVFGYFLQHHISPIVIFGCSLLSTIPLSYYNGMAIASISAQTSFAMGALINASFGSIIELILYVVSIKNQLEDVARAALTGALLGALLLIPGLSMIIGGIKYKEQKFNPAATGVSSVLLVISVVGAFSPTLFYLLYGNHSWSCEACTRYESGALSCASCQEVSINLDEDPVYINKARPLMLICSAILPIAYIVGLLFTLKTHAHIIHAKVDPEEEDEEGEHSAEWSKGQCLFVLLACTTMFSLISEKLVETLENVVESLHLTQGFLGVTLLAIVPSAAEYLNAIQFAVHNNMPLALEIGTSSAIQITLFQMPVLVVICAIINHMQYTNSFTLIFPMFDVFAIFVSVLIINLIYTNGKTNYFIGSSLVFVYVIIVSSFYFIPESTITSQ